MIYFLKASLRYCEERLSINVLFYMNVLYRISKRSNFGIMIYINGFLILHFIRQYDKMTIRNSRKINVNF